MNVYFSGIGGVGLGPLAQIAIQAGYSVYGSDAQESPFVQKLVADGVEISLNQDGSFLEKTQSFNEIDWFVYTSALPDDHPELVKAKELGIKISKRDGFLSELIKQKGLKLIAVAGTHGKTTATGMFVWALKQLSVPVSYSIGTTISFGPSGSYDPQSELFVYECDEFDKNFLNFEPFLSIVTSFDYDHPDTYPTPEDYTNAFRQYSKQCDKIILWDEDKSLLDPSVKETNQSIVLRDKYDIKIPGEHNRKNATLVAKAIVGLELASEEKAIEVLESFPGTDRRFEKLADNLYSDYGHHPVEIKATLEMANEISDNVTLVYQPHQNWRQHVIKDDYKDQFELASKIYWLPTYLSRENKSQPVISAQELTKNITNKDSIVFAELDDNLWQAVQNELHKGQTVLFMGAGSIDGWVRQKLKNN